MLDFLQPRPSYANAFLNCDDAALNFLWTAIYVGGIYECQGSLAPSIGVKMGSNGFLHFFKMHANVRKTTVFRLKYGGFMVAGEGFEPPTSGL